MKILKQLLIIPFFIFLFSILSATNSLESLNSELDHLNQQLIRLEDLARDRGERISDLLRGNAQERQIAFRLLDQNRNDISTRMNLQSRIGIIEQQISNF